MLGTNALLWHEDLDNTMAGPPELPKNLSFGAYDPSHAFADLKDSIAIEHIFAFSSFDPRPECDQVGLPTMPGNATAG